MVVPDGELMLQTIQTEQPQPRLSIRGEVGGELL
jgi:hypothetical protein